MQSFFKNCLYVLPTCLLFYPTFGQDCVPTIVTSLLQPAYCPNYALQLVFEDDFTGSSLDKTKWQEHADWSNTSGIAYCTTNENNFIFTGHSIQLIVKPDNITGPVQTYCKNSKVTNDVWSPLCLTDNGQPNVQHFDYSSGLLFSNDQNTFSGPGKFEIRCKLPNVPGLHPTFWLFGDCGQEVDIAECFVKNNEVLTDCHRNSTCTDKYSNCHNPLSFDITDFTLDFHTFSFEWDAFKGIWSVDGNQIRKFYRFSTIANETTDCPLAIGTYINQITLPTGSDNLHIIIGPGLDDPSLVPSFPQVMEVEYVKVWKNVAVTEPTCMQSTFLITKNSDITANWLVASDQIISEGHVTVSGSNHWQAGNEIMINSETNIPNGSEFFGEIAPCENSSGRMTDTSSSKKPQTINDSLSGNNTYSIFPNPNTGIFHLSMNSKDESLKDIYIYDVLGTQVYENLETSQSDLDIDLSKNAKGVYFIKVLWNGQVYFAKVLVV